MPTVRIHPLQQEYRHSGGGQFCKLCGAQEQWTAAAQPTVQGAAYDRSLHLTHLAREHLEDLQGTFSGAERKKEKSIDSAESDSDVEDESEQQSEQ